MGFYPMGNEPKSASDPVQPATGYLAIDTATSDQLNIHFEQNIPPLFSCENKLRSNQ